LTEQSTTQEPEKLQTVSQLKTEESVHIFQRETWLLKDNGEKAEKRIDIACTLMARDYKGLSTYGSNGVIEYGS
jgi:hypothetical protein